jgi:limonene-1,2-epoxide hydrolase
MRAFLTEAAVVDVSVRRVLVDGDDGAVEWVWTERRGDELVTMEDAIAFSVRDGLVTYWREYFDPTQTRLRDGPA